MQLNDKAAREILRQKIDAALAPLVSELGLTELRCSGIRYEPDGTAADLKITAKALSADGLTTEQVAWNRYAELFGLKPDWFGKEFRRTRGERVKIVGLQASRSKFPVIVEPVMNANGGVPQGKDAKQFLITIEEVQRKLGEGKTPIRSFSALGPLTRVEPPSRP